MRGGTLSPFDTRVPRTQVSNGLVGPVSNCVQVLSLFDIGAISLP